MNLTKQQTEELISRYCEMIVEDLDVDSLMNLCHELLVQEYEGMSCDDLQEHIVSLHGEDVLQDLLN